MILYFYDESGKVRSKRSGSADNLAHLLADPEVLCVESAEDHKLSEVLVDQQGQLVFVGAPPSSAHELNIALQQWELSLDKAKSQRWSQIKQDRDTDEFGSFEWGGYTFQCDEVSQRRIQGAVQLAAIDDTMTLDWTLADNSVQTFTAAEYVQIGVALANHVSQCHERGRILRLQINDATTQEELEAIVW